MNARLVPGSRRSSPNTPAIAEAVVILASFAALSAASSVVGDYWLQIGFRILIYLTLAEAWNLMAGFAGLVSLGTSTSVGLGAYVTFGLLNHSGLSLPVILTGCALAGAALATLVSPALFRLRGLYFTVGTLALAELLRLAMVNLSVFGGASGVFLQGDPPPLPALFRYALCAALLASLLMWACSRTRVSVLLRAVRDDEDAAAQVGVRPFRVKLAAFALASALGAIAGGIQATKLGAIEPYGMFGLQWSIDVLSMVIIGGVGFRLGPLIGTLFVVGLGEVLADYPEAHTAITGVILILVIRFAPQGLVGLAAALASKRPVPQAAT
jgi:branched-chain amino acid transport system permease protein